MMRVIVAIWLGLVIYGTFYRRVQRWWHRRQLRKELQLLRGGKPAPLFRFYPELDDRPTRPPIRSLRHRGDHDAA